MPTNAPSRADQALASAFGASPRQVMRARRADLIEPAMGRFGRGQEWTFSDLAHKQFEVVVQLTRKSYTFNDIAAILFIRGLSHDSCTKLYLRSLTPMTTKQFSERRIERVLKHSSLGRSLLSGSEIALDAEQVDSNESILLNLILDMLRGKTLDIDVLEHVLTPFIEGYELEIPREIAIEMLKLEKVRTDDWYFTLDELIWARNEAANNTLPQIRMVLEKQPLYRQVLMALIDGDKDKLDLMIARLLVPILILRLRFTTSDNIN